MKYFKVYIEWDGQVLETTHRAQDDATTESVTEDVRKYLDVHVEEAPDQELADLLAEEED